LLHLRPDLAVEDLRGNVETRLNAALDGRYDAVVLAEAGLNRLGLDGHLTERLGPPRFLPAVAQGALGLECRDGDPASRLVVPLDDPTTHACVVAERSLLAALGGGCVVPLGALAKAERGRLVLEASVLDPDGRRRLHGEREGALDDPEGLGRTLAEDLARQGAGAILAAARGER
jgi:hydroxymethylbilane synthase